MLTPATVRVLVVEDDRDDSLLINDLLKVAKRTDFFVDVAHTAAEGLTCLKRTRYDVLLVDYKLPDKSGLELLKDLQAAHHRVPVILVTSHGDRRLQADAFEAGIAEYLEKGTFTADLLERTCLYAIGLNDRQNSDGPGVGQLVQELVALTRDSVEAQTKTFAEMAELRKDLSSDVKKLEGHMEALGQRVERHKDEMIEKLSRSKAQAVTAWALKNPMAALVIVLLTLLAVVLTVFLTRVINTEAVKDLKELFSMLGGANVSTFV